MPKKKPVGRPKVDKPTAYDKPRQIGRWHDRDWQRVLDAIKKSGKSQTEWFRDVINESLKKQS